MADAPLHLAIFDVDGTLIDSQAEICAALREAFAMENLSCPDDTAIRKVIGLSVQETAQILAPAGVSPEKITRLAEGYKSAFVMRRAAGTPEPPLYPGARAALKRLANTDMLLATATGKARRGLDHCIRVHDLEGVFTATQSADDAPGKPHPGMVLNCLHQTGVKAAHAVMIGDTTFDMEMGRAAGVQCIGVSWGYHDTAALERSGADCIIEDFSELDDALAQLWAL